MTLAQIAKEIARHFEVSVDKMISGSNEERYVKARHIWRTIAFDEFKYTQTDIAKFEIVQRGAEYSKYSSTCRSSINVSIKKVLHEDLFDIDFHGALRKIRELFPDSPLSHEEVKMTDDGIVRVTQEEFDSRFYGHPIKVNPVTKNNWFPSWHFLYGKGAPPEEFLIQYYKSKGYFSDVEFHRAEVMGSYVHNRIEDMGNFNIDTTREQILRAFPNAKEARRVQVALKSWLTFAQEYEPQVISYEQKLIAKDWGGTVDLRARLNVDDYKNVWTIDFKTSKSVYDSHRAQVESYRREFGDDKASVLILGNTTKKGFTFSEVKEEDRDFFYTDFLNIKQVAYHRLMKENRIKPRENDMPDVFSLKGLNIKRI